MLKERRHNLILELIGHGGVRNQSGLRDALAARGVEVTQATLSRDLRELGVRKGPDGWEVPGQTVGQPEVTRRPLRQFALSVSSGGTVVVVKTGPGQAQVVALDLDRFPPAGVLGTLAGDDTVFIACESVTRSASLRDEFSNLVSDSTTRGGVA